jgi:PD-(D/E)XK nuclease superfamily
MTAKTPPTGAPKLNSSQRRTFDELLAVGFPRPVASPALAGVLRERIAGGLDGYLQRWTETRFFLSKSQLSSALRCPGLPVAEAAEIGHRRLHPATAIGIVTHRAVQLAHTHPDHVIGWYVKQSIASSRDESAFADFWDTAAPGTQSDVTVQAVSRTTAFMDTFPPLDPAWVWRFEESMQARIGHLVMAARPDLVLGRPHPDYRQTMFLCDLKTGSLQEHHQREAAFYALVSTLRHGVPPFRSVVLSLSSGEWTDPDIDEGVLLQAADDVIEATRRLIDGLTEAPPLTLTPGPHCRWCPARDTCPQATPDAKPTSKPLAPSSATPTVPIVDEVDPFAVDEAA